MMVPTSLLPDNELAKAKFDKRTDDMTCN